LTSEQKAQALAAGASAKKALDLRILDVRELCSFADFFIIATGTSARHVRALADATVEAAHELGERPFGIEGQETARWVLVDLDEVIVHLFQDDAREFFGLERLWGEASDVEPARAVGAGG
jgi:ribosome-associated protein